MTKGEVHNIASKYAPIFAQKISNEWKLADQIAPVDFPDLKDNEVTSRSFDTCGIDDLQNNPEKLMKLDEQEKIPAKIYYSFCKTSTHYFLLYAVYHILDWWKRYPSKNPYHIIRDKLDEHIHDMEGALLVISQKPEELVDAVITIAHGNFYLYNNDVSENNYNNQSKEPKYLRIAKFNEDVDGKINRDKESARVKLYCESKGHGVYGSKNKWGGGDQIWYYKPNGETADPRPAYTRDSSNDNEPVEQMDYELEDIFKKGGLWEHRFDPKVFMQNEKGVWGFVCNDEKKGKKYPTKANPPWSWNDRNDTSPVGEMATDPARLIIRYAQGWGPVSAHYLFNPYQGSSYEEE